MPAPTASRSPTPITADDACHLCGMYIARFPGPKGQALLRHQQQALKFCSTVDLFSWLLQPDSPALLHSAFVHDMGAAASWQQPDEAHYVEATQAWYVFGHNQKGAMGHTLASFKDKTAAEDFMRLHGGRLLRYEQIDMALLSSLGRM